jgi:hypothetical protein
MADVNGKAPSVELSDALHAGFDDAMARVASLNLDPCATLVDEIPAEIWASWDESKEIALVADKDGIDGSGVDDDEYEPLAA